LFGLKRSNRHSVIFVDIGRLRWFKTVFRIRIRVAFGCRWDSDSELPPPTQKSRRLCFWDVLFWEFLWSLMVVKGKWVFLEKFLGAYLIILAFSNKPGSLPVPGFSGTWSVTLKVDFGHWFRWRIFSSKSLKFLDYSNSGANLQNVSSTEFLIIFELFWIMIINICDIRMLLKLKLMFDEATVDWQHV